MPSSLFADTKNRIDTGSASVLDRNIQDLMEHRRERKRKAAFGDRVAGAVSAFAGSMTFVYIHAVIYSFWIIANLGFVPGVEPWDPSMVVLAMIASVEAIFLSTFILITQNRMYDQQDQRAELDLQITLLAEHEITRLVAMVSDIADKLGVAKAEADDVEEMKKDVAPRPVLERIEEKRREADDE